MSKRFVDYSTARVSKRFVDWRRRALEHAADPARPLAYARGAVPICPMRFLLIALAQGVKWRSYLDCIQLGNEISKEISNEIRNMITDGDIKRFGNDRGYLIVDDDPIELHESSSSSKRGGAPILIADENPATLEFFSRLLEDRGFTTLTADSGEAALRLLFGDIPSDQRRKPSGSVIRLPPRRPTKATLISNLMNPEEPRLIHVGIRPIRAILIGDIMKPPVDGLDLIRRLRPYHIPLVVATSYGADYTLLAKMAGAEIIIHKFADPVYVITTIEEALKRSSHFSPP